MVCLFVSLFLSLSCLSFTCLWQSLSVPLSQTYLSLPVSLTLHMSLCLSAYVRLTCLCCSLLASLSHLSLSPTCLSLSNLSLFLTRLIFPPPVCLSVLPPVSLSYPSHSPTISLSLADLYLSVSVSVSPTCLYLSHTCLCCLLPVSLSLSPPSVSFRFFTWCPPGGWGSSSGSG